MSTPTHFCPVCNAPWRGNSNLCKACGADLYDPDVQAFARDGQAAAAAGVAIADPSQVAAPGEAGVLGAEKILGVTRDGLLDGGALRRLGLLGGVVLLIAFVLPAVRMWAWGAPRAWGEDPQLEVTYKFSWQLWSSGHVLALAWPLIAGVVGLAVAIVPGLSARVRGGALALFGMSGLVVCLGRLGEYGMAPTQVATLTTAAVLIAGVAMATRMLWPQSTHARWGLIGAAAIFWLGMLIPVGDMTPRLPYDWTFYGDWLGADFSDVMPVSTIAAGADKRAITLFFVAVFMLLPLVLLPLTAWLSWRRPSGVWDKGGLALRPLAFLVCLYLPFLYALMAFSASGWEDQLSKSAMLGRIRLVFVALPLSLWAQFGLLAAIVAPRQISRSEARSAAAAPASTAASSSS